MLQVAGEKRWRVYEPLPRAAAQGQRWSGGARRAGGPSTTSSSVRATRSTSRAAGLTRRETSDSDSLHLTIGVTVYTRMDAVRAAVEACADDSRSGARPDDGETDDDLLAALAERLRPEQVVRRRRERFVRTRRPIREAELSQLRALDDLTLETAVERRPTVVADALTSEDVRIVFEGKEVVLPRRRREDVEFVAAAEGPFRPADLPGPLDDDGRLVLVRRLVREGFLRLSDSTAY